MPSKLKKIFIFGTFFFLLLLGCNLPSTTINQNEIPEVNTDIFPFSPPDNSQGLYLTPTPDPIKNFPPISLNPQEYTILQNDTLGNIAIQFNTSIQSVLEINPSIDANILYVGQVILIPAAIPSSPGSAFKLIPDSELIYGPLNHLINLKDFIDSHEGHMANYREEVNGEWLEGWEIITIVAENYSVNPRLLIAIIEYQSGWLTKPAAKITDLAYPAGLENQNRSGLYMQTVWIADNLNRGYYLWKIDALSFILTNEGQLIPLDPTINAGTAGLHYLFGKLYDENSWRNVVSESQFFQTYSDLYGNPFQWAIEPQIPPDLTQPILALPFEDGVPWYFTGGPHGGWDNGSAWAALDFAPPSDVLGCVENTNWVVAMADGLIVKAENGGVFQDLDGDGNLGTGWVLFYMHINTYQRVPENTILSTGDRIGHPSCEGGFSTGTHLHVARKFNGEWIAADGSIPFIMGDWTSHGNGILYNGYLQNSGSTIPACNCQSDENQITK